jgi:hypothetical protein
LARSSQTWKETERNRFLHVLHRNDNYIVFTLKMHWNCTTSTCVTYKKRAKNVPWKYRMNPSIHVICVVQRFPYDFHNVSMYFQCGNNTNPSINVICVKKTRTFLSYQVRDACNAYFIPGICIEVASILMHRRALVPAVLKICKHSSNFLHFYGTFILELYVEFLSTFVVFSKI